ncbi:ABC transporter ATP-binding protein uup [bioreactor metagenome]|uniref:ABC transporter ATP-binding protein uup n=1 Tax=bioreactor metagenome TaxID=1076179 RepID=A0A645GPW8_9ZZZZ
MLERFLFEGSIQFSYISKLSGGEKRRLYLLSILMEAPNVLLLDEPTNDLDIETLTILEDYIDNFNGAVIIVSHDRYFLDRVINKVFSFEGNSEILQLVGNYSDYREYKQEALQEVVVEKVSVEKKNKNIEKNKIDKPIKFTFKEQKEFEEIDEKIEEKELQLEEIQQQVNNSGSNFMLLQELLATEGKLKEELEFLMDRWTYLNEINEQIQEGKNNN